MRRSLTRSPPTSLPIILARHFIPHLLSVGHEANFLITSSGVAYIPLGIYLVYCPTKAAIHHFPVGLRQRLNGTNVNVIEIAPPYVATELDAAHRPQGGPGPMPLDEYTDKTLETLNTNQAAEIKEAAVGFAAKVLQPGGGRLGRCWRLCTWMVKGSF